MMLGWLFIKHGLGTFQRALPFLWRPVFAFSFLALMAGEIPGLFFDKAPLALPDLLKQEGALTSPSLWLFLALTMLISLFCKVLLDIVIYRCILEKREGAGWMSLFKWSEHHNLYFLRYLSIIGLLIFFFILSLTLQTIFTKAGLARLGVLLAFFLFGIMFYFWFRLLLILPSVALGKEIEVKTLFEKLAGAPGRHYFFSGLLLFVLTLFTGVMLSSFAMELTQSLMSLVSPTPVSGLARLPIDFIGIVALSFPSILNLCFLFVVFHMVIEE